MKYTNTYGVSVDFKPWFDEGYKFTKLQIIEELGGSIPSGTIDLELDGSEESLKLITDQYTGTLIIEKDDGNIFNIDIFITSRKFFKNSLSLSFVCVKDKSFLTSLVSTNYPNMDDALRSIYPGNLDIRCSSDVPNSTPIIQSDETNYSLCTKLGYSYRQRCIFGFGWEGLLIKEIVGIDSNGDQEPKISLSGGGEFNQIDSYNLNYDKELYFSITDPWVEDYSDLVPKNVRSIRNYEGTHAIGTEYSNLLENYLYNKRYLNSELFVSLRIVGSDFPGYKLGDVITYVRGEEESKLPFTIFLVKSNELFISIEGSKYVDESGLNFSWTSKILGLQENGTLLPTSDPTNI